MVNPTPHSTNRFSVLEGSTIGSMRDMLTPQSTANELRTKQAMPQKSSHPPSTLTPLLIFSATLQRGTELPLQIHVVGSNAPLLIVALIDLGVMGKFIDIDYVQSNNLHTQCLPQAIPIYNIDGTLNEVGYITEVMDLIIQYKGNLEEASFHVTGICQTTIILGHTWIMEHNPEIDWCTGEVTMTHCPSSCGPETIPK